MSRSLPRVIGLYSPREQSGKSTVMAHLEKAIIAPQGKTMVNIKISAPLKQPLYDLGLTEEEVEGKLKEVPHAKLGGQTPRQVMIDTYKNGATKDGPDWLSKQAAQRILHAILAGHIVVVDDVRTPEDYAMIRLFAGSDVWRLMRPKPGEDTIGQSTNLEGMLEDKFFEFRIDNDGSLEDLYWLINRYFLMR